MGGSCLTMLEPTCCSNPTPPCWEDVDETDARFEPRILLFMLELTKYGTLLLVIGIPPPYHQTRDTLSYYTQKCMEIWKGKCKRKRECNTVGGDKFILDPRRSWGPKLE